MQSAVAILVIKLTGVVEAGLCLMDQIGHIIVLIVDLSATLY